MIDNLFNRPKRRIHGTRRYRGILKRLSAARQNDVRRRAHFVAAGDDERIESVSRHVFPGGGAVGFRERGDIAVGHRFLSVGERLERLENFIDAFFVALETEFGQPFGERVTARMLAEHHPAFLYADRFGRHDFVSERVRDDAVLMNARFVGERVLADDRFVGRDFDAGDRLQHFGGLGDFLASDVRRHSAETVAARFQRHDDLFERGVARALADSAYRALYLPRAGGDAGERIGDREPEIVVAVNRNDRVADVGNAIDDGAHKSAELLGRRIADGVGNVKNARSGGDCGLGGAAEKIDVGARGVFGRELDVAAFVARIRHHFADLPQRVLTGHFELVFQMQIARREKRVDARPRGGSDGLPRRVDILFESARKRRHACVLHDTRHAPYAFEVSGRGDRESRFDHIRSKEIEPLGHARLLVESHRIAGGLLPVAEGRVEYRDAPFQLFIHFSLLLVFFVKRKRPLSS